jgi:hypothetical protein
MLWQDKITESLRDFETVSKLAGSPIQPQNFFVEFFAAPHKPPKLLPIGKMAIYGFYWNDIWLKVGKAGPQSQARYTSQHYNPASAPSTLAASLLRDVRMKNVPDLQAGKTGDWIKDNCCRVNILVPVEYGRAGLSLLEAFLHVRLRPRYEG